MVRNIFIVFSLLLSICHETSAYKPIVISDDIDSYEIDESNVLLLEDASLNMTISEVAALPDAAFLQNAPLYNQNTKSDYWIKFKVNSKAKEKKKWILEILDSRHNEIILFSKNEDGAFSPYITGIDYDFESRRYKHKNFVIDLDLSSNGEHVYFLKVKSRVVASLLFKVRSNNEFSNYAFNEYYLLGLYYGILLIILVYNLIIYFTLKEKIYLFYVFYIVVWGWHSMLDDGLGYQYLWSRYPVISNLGFVLAKPLLLTLFVFYSRKFLNLKWRYPQYDKYIVMALFAYVAVEFVHIIFDFRINYVKTAFFLLPFFFIYVLSVMRYKTGFEPARFFILGNTFVLLGIFIRATKDVGIFEMITKSPNLNIFAIYSQNLGMVLEIAIFSLALADRIRFLKKNKDEAQLKVIEKLKENKDLSQKVNHELENKVKERTKELMEKTKALEEANVKLASQAEEINRWNKMLDLDNHKLKKDIQEVMEARIKFKDISYEEFLRIFPDDLACMRYINDIKWKDGYKCKKCNNEKYCKGGRVFSRRCTKCRYDESITAFTFLHKCKFSLVKAFYIIMKVNKYGDKVNCNELARQLDMRKSTVWEFKKRIMEELKSNKIKYVPDEDSLDSLILKPKVA